MERKALRKNHKFQFSNDVASCACGRWAITKIPMTAAQAQQLAKRYGRQRFGPNADSVLKHGVPFTALRADEALKSWECHIKNLPEKGERIHGCSYIKQKRLETLIAV